MDSVLRVSTTFLQGGKPVSHADSMHGLSGVHREAVKPVIISAEIPRGDGQRSRGGVITTLTGRVELSPIG